MRRRGYDIVQVRNFLREIAAEMRSRQEVRERLAENGGDSAVAEKVFTRSLRGDYVITPGMLMGEESVEFIGRDIAETTAPTASVASAAPAYEETDYDDLGW